MDDTFIPVFLLILTVIGLPALLVLLSALIPDYVQRAQTVMRARPWRSLFLGLVNTVFFGVLALFAGSDFAPVVFLGGVSLFIVLPLCLLVGLLVATGIVGERVWTQLSSTPARLLKEQLLGIFILGPALLVPIFGWLLFLGLILSGLGAGILALFQRPRPEGEPETALPVSGEVSE